MTHNQALNYLGISEISEAEDAIEQALFLLRQQIISKGNIPQLLIARKNKLKQLKQVSKTLSIEYKSEFNNMEINNLYSFNLIDSFNIYHKNKTLIFQQISSNLNFETLDFSIDNLILNLKMYCQFWPELNLENEENILLSKELDSMNMLALLKELELKGICEFSDLNTNELPETLVYEIKRLNALKKQFEE
jgi:hypothetical protein